MDSNTSTQVQPNASVIIFNYNDRLVTTQNGNPNSSPSGFVSSAAAALGISPGQIVGHTFIPNSSLIGIKTSKSKSSPTGTFEFYLAPNANWLGQITTGSWCCILMTRSNSLEDLPAIAQTADQATLKMVGRIESVRLAYSVNPQTGARQTMYVVTGEDWGSVFESLLYIDTLANNPTLSAPGNAESVVFANYQASYLTTQGLMSTDNIANAILDIWGSSPLAFSELLQSIVLKSRLFEVPVELASYLGLIDQTTYVPSQNFGAFIQRNFGVLLPTGSYVEIADTFLKISTDKFIGTHTFWQLLVENCNMYINELVSEIEWGGDGLPNLTLYKRIKPFALRTKFEGSGQVSEYISLFKNLDRYHIPLAEIIDFNAGTNWKDKINFVEVLPEDDSQYGSAAVDAKISSQAFDDISFNRDGFKPLKTVFNAYPVELNPLGGFDISPRNLTKFKYLLKEWYFNTHNMLNGSLTIIGQDNYIPVGQNIIIDAQILGDSLNFNYAVSSTDLDGPSGAVSSAIGTIGSLSSIGSSQPVLPSNRAYLLAHVESVNHSFSVNLEGARSFFTTITFVRGVITDNNGQIIDNDSIGGVDQYASDLSSTDRQNSTNTVTSNFGFKDQ